MRFWNRTVHFFSHTEVGTAQALVRICAGLLVIALFLQPLIEGVVPPIWLNVRDGGIFPITKWPYLIRWLGGYSSTTVLGLIALGLLSGTAIAIGFWHRLFAFLALQVVIAITALNPYTPNGGDNLLTNILWLLIFSDASKTLSIQARWRHQSWVIKDKISAWPRYLMIIQLCILYCSAGFQKLSTHWIPFGDGQALWYILNMPAYARTNFEFLAWVSPLLQLSSYVSWLFENLGPWLLLLTLRAENHPYPEHLGRISRFLLKVRGRLIFILVGLSLHLGIFLTMNVGLFSWMALMYYPSIFSGNWLTAIQDFLTKKSSANAA